jgi:hypothetical protein
MLQRCTQPSHLAFARYSGRGIKVCEQWMRFENFYADLGPRPKGTTLERINNDLGYEPGNVIWATRKQQERNKRVTVWVEYQGRKMSLTEACTIAGAEYQLA